MNDTHVPTRYQKVPRHLTRGGFVPIFALGPDEQVAMIVELLELIPISDSPL